MLFSSKAVENFFTTSYVEIDSEKIMIIMQIMTIFKSAMDLFLLAHQLREIRTYLEAKHA